MEERIKPSESDLKLGVLIDDEMDISGSRYGWLAAAISRYIGALRAELAAVKSQCDEAIDEMASIERMIEDNDFSGECHVPCNGSVFLTVRSFLSECASNSGDAVGAKEAYRVQLAAAKAEVERLKLALSKQQHDIQQTLGRALGFPRYCDDPGNFPDAVEADGVCVGEHVAESLADMAVNEIEALKAEAAACHRPIADAARAFCHARIPDCQFDEIALRDRVALEDLERVHAGTRERGVAAPERPTMRKQITVELEQDIRERIAQHNDNLYGWLAGGWLIASEPDSIEREKTVSAIFGARYELIRLLIGFAGQTEEHLLRLTIAQDEDGGIVCVGPAYRITKNRF